MSLGNLMLDIDGPQLSAEDRELLQHPAVGGVILFSRNYTDREQLVALTEAIHGLRTPMLLIAVDHEGGRVQRFRDGFSRLPPMLRIGELYDTDPAAARRTARDIGWLMAGELREVGIDFSFAPVLDVADRNSRVINDRGFHQKPDVVGNLASALIDGLHEQGMSAVGKHFPGHGSVDADSHHELPVDDRDFADIEAHDLVPFRRLSEKLEGVMPAHVRYSKVDDEPAGFSRLWLSDILRNECEFQGVIFSDDLNMAGAHVAGDVCERANAALRAGCDMILHCNDRAGVVQLLNDMSWDVNPVAGVRLMRMHGRGAVSADFRSDPRFAATQAFMAALESAPELDLTDDNPA